MSEFGFKITGQTSIANVVKIVRKYKDLSISDIKGKIDNDEYIFACDTVDEEACALMFNCISDLNESKISTQLYERDKAIDLQLLINWLESSQKVSAEVDAEMLLEGEAVDLEAIQKYAYLWTAEQSDWVVIQDKYGYSIVNVRTKQFFLMEDDDLNNQVAAMMIMQGSRVVDKNSEEYTQLLQ
ncbi:MAG: hypothetical protein HUJ71_10670 [Pseudobutyrivibrio sp.]|nr:hypothetical protein [Pseudobutyrivibrio sp.]